MDYITRSIEPLSQYVTPGRVLVIYGPRRVGKTTLIQQLVDQFQGLKSRFETGDDIEIQAYLGDLRIKHLLAFVDNLELLVIDEAQNITNIGQVLKIIVDNRPDLRVVVSGSASFELANQLGEPLTGRHTTLTLYPIAQLELLRYSSPYELNRMLEERLIYGSYPDVVTADNDLARQQYLDRLVSSYLFRDVLAFERVRSPKRILDLLRLIAFQVGSEMSLAELANRLSIDQRTIARYLDLFEKAFILYRLGGYSGNLRKEVASKSKYYFYDTGIRNAIIANYAPLAIRNDRGALWENFCVIERLKRNAYTHQSANNYFWRTYTKQEIDYVEEAAGMLAGFECKFSPKKTVKAPIAWRKGYPQATFTVVNTENYLAFVADSHENEAQAALF